MSAHPSTAHRTHRQSPSKRQTRNKEELHQLFFDLRDKLGQTFVIVTHDENLARLTDRTIHMVDGRISLKI